MKAVSAFASSCSNRQNYTSAYTWAICLCGGGRVQRWCCVNFQCRDVLLIWIRIGQGSTALAVGAGVGCWTFLCPATKSGGVGIMLYPPNF